MNEHPAQPGVERLHPMHQQKKRHHTENEGNHARIQSSLIRMSAMLIISALSFR